VASLTAIQVQGHYSLHQHRRQKHF
jgi:hypothetical protein